MKKYTTESFIEKSKKVHGEKYDYSKVEYVNSNTKVCIICPEHGEFYITPGNFLYGQGCRLCGIDERKNKRSCSYNDFIKKAIEVHGNKYDYSKVEYINCDTKICIVCPTHGEFYQTPYHHINEKNGCPKCANNVKYTNEEFIEKARKIHGNKYDYSKLEYEGSLKKVCIICPEHGEFWMEPSHHLLHMGCPKCSTKRLEKEVENALIKNNIKYIWQANNKTFKWLNKQSLDFYLPEHNIAIECQGEQHFRPKAFFGGEKRFAEQLERDKRKNNLCTIHNIKLIYFTHEKNTLYECINSVDKLLTIIKGG